MAARTWHFDAAASSPAGIRVVALRADEAARVGGARERVELLYDSLCAGAEYPIARVKTDVAKAFEDQSLHNYTLLAFYDNANGVAWEHNRIVGCTRVSSCGARVTGSSIAVDQELHDAQQRAIECAVVAAADELAQEIARAVLGSEAITKSPRSIMIWQAQVGASEYLKQLHVERGYTTELAQRLEMTAFLKGKSSVEAVAPACEDAQITFRAWDVANDNFDKVYSVVKAAFGSNPPSLEAWKRHYAQHPRFSDELSCIAWHGEEPACVVAVELMVDGEGGGPAELGPLFTTDRVLARTDGGEPSVAATKLQFPEDYEQRKAQIRATAKTAYVCCVGTSPAHRGKRLGQISLEWTLQAAAKAGLETVYLCTDRQNPAAVKAYSRAGMVVTKVTDLGNMTAKEVVLDP